MKRVTRDPLVVPATARGAGRFVAELSALVEGDLNPGVTSGHLDGMAEAHIRKGGAIPSFKGYPGINPRRPFPGSLCISIDDEIVHIEEGTGWIGRCSFIVECAIVAEPPNADIHCSGARGRS